MDVSEGAHSAKEARKCEERLSPQGQSYKGTIKEVTSLCSGLMGKSAVEPDQSKDS